MRGESLPLQLHVVAAYPSAGTPRNAPDGTLLWIYLQKYAKSAFLT